MCGFSVDKDNVFVKIAGEIPSKIVIKLTGTRRGFMGKRFEKFTYEEMKANNSFWQQWR